VEFLVVQDILASELTALAHVVLPGTSAAEKSGTVTSLDHRVSTLRPAVSPRGQARPDWDILADLYQRLAPAAAPAGIGSVQAEMRELLPIYTAVCSDSFCQKALYRPAEKGLAYSQVESRGAAGELELLTGKILYHFGTTSTFAEGNLEVAPAGYIEMHPEDADRLGIREGGTVRVTSATGSAQGPVRLSRELNPGLLFAPYHFGDVNIQSIMPIGQNRVAVQVSKV
jgi:formate dehydrogenase alpha subunit